MATYRLLALLLFALFAEAGLARAQGAEPAVEILNWGLTRAKDVGTETAPDTPTGYNRLVDGPVEVIRAEKITACLGTSFGVMYAAFNIPDFQIVPIMVVVQHPAIHTPDGRVMLRSSWPDGAIRRQRYAGWVFEKSYELVSGVWTFSLQDAKGHEYATKSFDVLAGNCPIS
ncbi:DUF3859 domain-containing protein [Phyllobacterium meliloti]|uniref:DUF3859 domain-containing protein n=1 Tax=Phyllobacterium meliloti TaxID=555317 RepID=UPI001D134170|nr:DUF3859 domain-containing protein [Phyllobacterium sp. T1293]UGX85337.1 DUF3859 domain-containing protein [Phyllobacterium sp. T1293]